MALEKNMFKGFSRKVTKRARYILNARDMVGENSMGGDVVLYQLLNEEL